MTLVAPLTATGAMIPASVALVTGTAPSPIVIVGMAAALLGAVVVARPPARPAQDALSRSSLLVAVLALTLFGGWSTLVQRASQIADGHPLGITAVGTLAGLLAQGLATSLRRLPVPHPPPQDRPGLAAISLLDAAGLSFFAAASEGRSIAAIAVLGALYPLATVLLARVVLSERVRGNLPASP